MLRPLPLRHRDVEDPATYEWLPTCHRASFDSFLEDVDYLAAVEHSDGITRRQYQKDAAKIAEVQRGILATSQNTEPYDAFISYKELDENGERTRDSILAQEVYYRLTEKGWRVFFSRITLEDVPGTQYEPYIFAALNSAKVMIVVGTSAENLNAGWVKNEWSRFLSMMRKDKSKLLIPCYRDMDPYDLPEQLAVLMSYDMGKIGFIQDLIRGVDKVLSAEKEHETVKETVVVQQGGGPNVTALLKRGQQALEDSDWDKAKEFYDQVLNMDAENADAFFGLFLAGAKCADESVYINRTANQQGRTEQLSIAPAADRIRTAVKANIVPGFLNETEIRKLFDFDLSYPSAVAGQNAVSQQEKNRIETNRNLNRAFQYASGSVLERLNTFKARLFSGLDKRAETAKAQAEAARKAKENAYEEHLARAEAKAVALRQKAEEKREADYQAACEAQSRADSAYHYLSVINDFRKIEGYKDSAERIGQCEASIRELEEQERLRKEAEAKAAAERAEAERKKKEAEAKAAAEEAERQRILAERAEKERKEKQKKLGIIAGIVAAVAIAAILIMTKIVVPENRFKKAEALLKSGEIAEAWGLWNQLLRSSDNQKIANHCFEIASLFEECGEPAYAAVAFGKLSEKGYPEAKERSLRIWDRVAPHRTIDAGGHQTAAVKEDGTVLAVGFNDDLLAAISEWKDVTEIDISDSFSPMALLEDGTVIFALGPKNKTLEDFTEIVSICQSDGAGYYEGFFGLKYDGTVVQDSSVYSKIDTSSWSDIRAIAGGQNFVIGVRLDGTVVAEGELTYYTGANQTGDYVFMHEWNDIVGIAVYEELVIGLTKDGHVVSDGYSFGGGRQTDSFKDCISISAGCELSIGLHPDGTVICTKLSMQGLSDYGQDKVDEWHNIVAIAAGGYHTVGLKEDGTVVAIGRNDSGQCDVSAWKDIKLPNT